MHLDFYQTSAAAGFAAAAPGVEGKPPRAVSAGFGVLGFGENIPNVPKQAGISGRVGPRRAADRGLVDGDDLVQVFQALDLIEFARPGSGAVELGGQVLI